MSSENFNFFILFFNILCYTNNFSLFMLTFLRLNRIILRVESNLKEVFYYE